MVFAKTPELRNCFELYTTTSVDSLFQSLVSYSRKNNNIFSTVEYIPQVKFLSEPSDYFWQNTGNSPDDWMWYLKKIQANLAWDITKGDTAVKVAVIDSKIDPTHPDLKDKIDPPYDFYTGLLFDTNHNEDHGTTIATLIAAETKDAGQTPNGDMPSVGYNTRIMYSVGRALVNDTFIVNSSISYTYPRPDIVALYASTVRHAKVINISWSEFEYGSATYNHYLTYFPQSVHSTILIEKEILDNGTSIVRAAGNKSEPDGTEKRLYPFSGYEDERTIVVSSTGPDDRHLYLPAGPNYTHSHYPEVDLCAPGYKILCSVNTHNSWPYATYGGTSQSAPLVVGTIALMYAVNPCMAPAMVQDILKQTTDPILDAANYPGQVGTGRLNTYKAVKAAQESHSGTLDLYIKDRPEDLGNEEFPYHWQAARDKSPDIWVRNQDDGIVNRVHQEPEYTSGSPVFVYVRVRNKSCAAPIGTETVNLYWSKASSMTSWPANWDGTYPAIGNLVGSKIIGNLRPGTDTILKFEWNILNPYMYQNWASCLLARIENSATDVITIYPDRADDDVFFNNNVALRNCSVIDVVPGLVGSTNTKDFVPHGKYVFWSNELAHPEHFDLVFNPADSAFLQEAEVNLYFDSAGWRFFKDRLASSGAFRIKSDGIAQLVRSGELSQVEIPAKTKFPVYFGFSFYSDRVQQDSSWLFDFFQRFSDSKSYIGGEHFTVNKYQRNPFAADAGEDKEITFGDSLLLSAISISEDALYNWYNAAGELIYSGKDLNLHPEISEKYQLEVIALSDGAKSYDNVHVQVKNNFLVSISPNPVSINTNVKYSVSKEISSSYLMIINQTGTEVHNYLLNISEKEINLNLDALSVGVHTLVLICNGIATDAKLIIK
jgi:subtilisin family serine protease